MAVKKWFHDVTARIQLMISVKNWQTLKGLFAGEKRDSVQWLTLRKDGVRFGVSSPEQVMSMKACLIDRVYTRYSGGIGKDWTVVDIGAAIGGFTVEAARQANQGRVIALEPNVGSINVLRQNVRANQLQNVESLNLGVWYRDGEIPLCICDKNPLEAKTSDTETVEEPDTHDCMVPVITLENLVEEKVTGEIDLLKLDCEGAEFAFLLNQPARLFDRIKRIVMEYHDLEPEKTHVQLKEFLESIGYNVRVYGNPLDKRTGYLSAIWS